MRSFTLLLLASALAAASAAAPVSARPSFAAQAAATVTPDSEPSHHLVLANDYVRVYRVEVAPHSSTLLHRHAQDYIWVSLGPADVTNAVHGKPPVTLKLADGEVHFTPGNFSHVATNNSAQPFRNYTVVLLKHGGVRLKPGEEARGVNLLHSGNVESLFVNDGVRALDITLNPGASISGPHLARPHLLLDISPDDHHVAWSNGGASESLNNPTPRPARFLLLEF